MTQLMTKPIDAARVDQMTERLIGVARDATLALMLSVGHRTGLFDTMAALDEAVTSQALAGAAGLHERYVREWLGCMTTARIVNHDPATETYHLPAEHAALLTRAADPNNLGVMMQWIAVLGGVEDHVVKAFRHGKGVPYSAYHRFHEVMQEVSDQTTVANLLDRILPMEPGLKERLVSGIDVLDFACGRGRAMIHLASHFPNSRFRGIDLQEEPIADARREAAEQGLMNVRFDVVDAAALNAVEAYDLITGFDAVHDQRAPDTVLANVHRALRPGGVFLMQEVAGHTHHHGNMDQPLAVLIYAISTFHCMSVSLAQGGPGLGAAWGKEKALMMLEDAGFQEVRVEQIESDIVNWYYLMTE